MVSSIGGSPSLQPTQATGTTPNASTAATKKSLDMEKQLGNAVIQLMESSSLHKGTFVNIKA